MDEDHSKGESGASDTFPKQCSALRKGEHVVIKNHPCKIVDMSTSKTGKHGHAKVHMVALDIFTGKKYEDICPSTHNMTCPNVKRVELQVLDIDEDGFFSLLADDGNTRDDLQLNDAIEQAEKKEMIKRAKDCVDGEGECHATVLKAMDHEWIIDIKQKQVKK